MTGYGDDLISMAKALLGFGADVYLQPTHVDVPIPFEILPLFTKELKAPFDLIINHWDPAKLQASEAMNQACDCVVGWSMWEFSSMENMKTTDLETLEERLKRFNFLFVYDEVSAGALAPYWENPIVLQGGYDAPSWKLMQRDWFSEEFHFCMVGSCNARKAPFVAIETFKDLKDTEPDFVNAELHLKVSSPAGLHPRMEEWCPGLHLHQEMWNDQQMKDFYGRMHVLLAPSRGEGKNLPALQFMSTGGTVVATNWSGHTKWLNSSYSYPLKYELEPISRELPDCLWATPDRAHLKEIMLNVVRNRGEVRRKAELAGRTIPQICSWENVLERFFKKIEEAGRPDIMAKWQKCKVEADNLLIRQGSF